MAGRVARPDDEIYLVLQVLVDPSKGLIDEGKRRVAVAGFCAKVARWAFAPMTGMFFVSGRVVLVEGVRVKI